MKKRMRMMMCLVLVVLMVASLAAPVMAASDSGTGTRNGYTFIWTITREQSTGVANIRTTGTPTYLTSSVKNQLFYDLTGDWGETELVTVTGYANVSAIANNQMKINGVPVRATIKSTKGIFEVNGSRITDGYYVGTWENI